MPIRFLGAAGWLTGAGHAVEHGEFATAQHFVGTLRDDPGWTAVELPLPGPCAAIE